MKRLLTIAAIAIFVLPNLSWSQNTPVMGWSSWNTFGININEDLIRQQADAMIASGLYDCGYRFINIDDGYMNGRDEKGTLCVNAKRFPNGMRSLVDYLHAKGLKAGIYSDGGNNTCASNDQYPWGLGVGMAGHEEQDCKTFFRDWDFDFIKVDYCGGSRSGLDERTQYTRIGNAIKNCGKPGVIYNVCRWEFPGTWILDVADSWRTTGDIRDNWASVKRIVNENLFIQTYTGKGHYNDCDMLEMGRALTNDEERTHMAYWCITSSPLLIGCDMRNIRPGSLELLKNPDLIAMNQDPLGLGAHVNQHKGYDDVYVVAKDMETIMGPKRAVLVINLTDSTRTMPVNIESLGFMGKVKFYDCFTHKDIDGEAEGTFMSTVAAHGTNAYFVTGERIEKPVYQGEDAFLHDYEETGRSDSPLMRKNVTADMGMYVHHLGNRPGNYLEWRDVYSMEGGEYTLTIRYASQEPRSMTVTVNDGQKKRFTKLSSGDYTNKWSKVEVKVTFKKGYNTVRLSNKTDWMPNVDCMEIKCCNSFK